MRKEIRDHLDVDKHYKGTLFCDGFDCMETATWVVKRFLDPRIYDLCERHAFPLRETWRQFVKWTRTLYRGKYKIDEQNKEE